MNGSSTRRETAFSSTNGYLAACAGIVLLLGAAWMFKTAMGDNGGFSALFGAMALLLAAVFFLTGLFMLQPNESAILTLFGKYIGTDRSEGLRWAFPLYVKRRLSLRARNFNAPTLKVLSLIHI